MGAQTLLRILAGVDQTSVQNFHLDEAGLVLHVAPTWRRARCGVCDRRCRGVHDRRKRSWRHRDLGGMTVRFTYAIRRAWCPGC